MNLTHNFDNKMFFPEDFKKRCKELYPNNNRIKYLLGRKSYLLRYELKKQIPAPLGKKAILRAYKKGTMDELVKIQVFYDKAEALYEEFLKLYEEQYLSKGKAINEYYGNVYYSDQIKLQYNIDHGYIERGDRVTRSQLANLERNLASRTDQNIDRRAAGEDRAGKYRTR